MVLLLNTHDQARSKPIAQCFWRIMEGYITSHVRVCFLCYRAYPQWLGNILSQCEAMNEREKDARIKMTLAGRCATVLAIIGSKKQLSIFPEPFDGCHGNRAVSSNGKVRTVGQILGNSLGFEDHEEDDCEQSRNHAHFSNAKPIPTSSSSGDGHDSSSHGQRNGQVQGVSMSASSGTIDSGDHGHDPRVEQIKQLDVWMERLFDGSLKRFRVHEWPEWHQ